MFETDPQRAAVAALGLRPAADAALALLLGVTVLLLGQQLVRRAHHAAEATGVVAFEAAPAAPLDLAAAPAVTTPSASVARFNVALLRIIADLVDVRRSAALAIARLGGLHGP